MNTRPRSESTEQQIVKVIAFICIISAPLWVYGLFFPFPPNFPLENKLPALVLVLVVVLAVQVILIRRMTAGDHFMAQVMIVGFLLKLAAVSAYMFMAVRFYGVADLFYYFDSGLRIVDKHSLTGDWTFLRPLFGNNFMIMLNSWLVFVLGPAFQALMILFATLSYWGQYLFYRAFCIAVPTRQHKSVALFMFFLPSLVFWTATIGKDAVAFFFIGACSYGFAKMAQRTSVVGLVTILISLGGVMLARPHVAGMLAISLCSAYLLSKNQRGLLGMAAKTIGIPLLLLASVYFITQARTLMDFRDISQTQARLERLIEVDYQVGGSGFGSSLTYRLVAAPFLLFRPFLWEVRSPQVAIAGIEALGLMIFFWRRRHLMVSSLRSWRENAFVLFLWVYALEFSILFAAVLANFGILARQRVMLTPLALMIVLSQPPCSVGSVRIRR